MFKRVLILVLLLSLSACSSQIGQIRRVSDGLAPIVLMSDFGTYNEGIAICKGVMLKIQPGLSFVDVTHQIPAFSVRDAARFLANLTPNFPEGTVFVVLVEKYIEKTARPIVAKNKRGQYFVLSDNGILSLISERGEIEKVREVKENSWLNGGKLISTFMGRDVYAPLAAHLARGEDWSEVGPEMEKINLLDKKALRVSETQVAGDVIALEDPFGNLVTDITATAFLNAKYVLGDKVSVLIGTTKHVIPFVKTYDDVRVNEKLLYIDSTDHVAVAIHQGDFAGKYKIKPPVKFVISIKKEK